MRFVLGALVLAPVTVVGCGSDATERTDERYCATVQQHLAELTNPNIATPGQISSTIDLYRTIAKAAPLALEQEWDVLTIAYETAATVVPGDQASLQKAADTIRAAQPSAKSISDYTQRLCNAQIGPSIVPTTLLAGTTTTDPDAPGTSASSSTSIDPAATTLVPTDTTPAAAPTTAP